MVLSAKTVPNPCSRRWMGVCKVQRFNYCGYYVFIIILLSQGEIKHNTPSKMAAYINDRCF